MRLVLQPIVKDFAVGMVEHARYGGAQFEHQRRDFLVQSRLVIHRRQQSDRDHDKGLILRRPQRHREAVDMRAP